LKLAHTIKLSVFVNEGESEELVLEKLKSFLPLDFEHEKLKIERRVSLGLRENKIITLEFILEKEKHTNLFIETLLDKLSQQQKELLLKQAGSRLDNDLNFFMRLDKPRLLEENKYFITDSGSCFHITMRIACFPSKREKALEVIQKIFK